MLLHLQIFGTGIEFFAIASAERALACLRQVSPNRNQFRPRFFYIATSTSTEECHVSIIIILIMLILAGLQFEDKTTAINCPLWGLKIPRLVNLTIGTIDQRRYLDCSEKYCLYILRRVARVCTAPE